MTDTPQAQADPTAEVLGEWPKGFHAKDGLHFLRLDDGSVRVSYHQGTLIEVDLDPSTWASAVASVSVDGENRDSYHDALSLHDGTAR